MSQNQGCSLFSRPGDHRGQGRAREGSWCGQVSRGRRRGMKSGVYSQLPGAVSELGASLAEMKMKDLSAAASATACIEGHGV